MKQRRFRRPALLAALLCLIAGALRADGFIVIPRPPHPGPAAHFPLEVARHDVRVTIDGQLATTTVDQEFYNPNDSRLEGFYLFPLPAGAVIRIFSMWIDGRETRAELLDAAKARGIYEDIVRRLRDPALLEYDGRGVFRMRVFPIEPRSRKRIKISYHEVLERSNGAVAYLYPLAHGEVLGEGHPRGQHRPGHSRGRPPWPPFTAPPIRWRSRARRPAGPRCATAAATPFPTATSASSSRPDAGRLGFSLLSFRPRGQEGTFFLSVAPGFAEEGGEVAAKDITFVVDTSGSMAGRAMEQARSAIAYCLEPAAPPGPLQRRPLRHRGRGAFSGSAGGHAGEYRPGQGIRGQLAGSRRHQLRGGAEARPEREGGPRANPPGRPGHRRPADHRRNGRRRPAAAGRQGRKLGSMACAFSPWPSAARSTPTCWTGSPNGRARSAPTSPLARRSRAASPASSTRSAPRSCATSACAFPGTSAPLACIQAKSPTYTWARPSPWSAATRARARRPSR